MSITSKNLTDACWVNKSKFFQPGWTPQEVREKICLGDLGVLSLSVSHQCPKPP